MKKNNICLPKEMPIVKDEFQISVDKEIHKLVNEKVKNILLECGVKYDLTYKGHNIFIDNVVELIDVCYELLYKK